MRVEPASLRENRGDGYLVVSTLRSPVPASLHLLALQLKRSLSGLRTPEHPFFTTPQVTRRGRKGYELDRQRCADYCAICWTIL